MNDQRPTARKRRYRRTQSSLRTLLGVQLAVIPLLALVAGSSPAQVTEVESPAELQDVERIELRGSQVYDLSRLAELKNLRDLRLGYTKATDLTALAGVEFLETAIESEEYTADEVEVEAARAALELLRQRPRIEEVLQEVNRALEGEVHSAAE